MVEEANAKSWLRAPACGGHVRRPKHVDSLTGVAPTREETDNLFRVGFFFINWPEILESKANKISLAVNNPALSISTNNILAQREPQAFPCAAH